MHGQFQNIFSFNFKIIQYYYVHLKFKNPSPQ